MGDRRFRIYCNSTSFVIVLQISNGNYPRKKNFGDIGRKVDVLLWLLHRQRARTKEGELMIFLKGEAGIRAILATHCLSLFHNKTRFGDLGVV